MDNLEKDKVPNVPEEEIVDLSCSAPYVNEERDYELYLDSKACWEQYAEEERMFREGR